MAATAQRLFGPPRHQAPKESEFLRVLEISRFLGEKGVAERLDFPGSICSKGRGWEPIRCSNLLRKRFRFLVADHKNLDCHLQKHPRQARFSHENSSFGLFVRWCKL